MTLAVVFAGGGTGGHIFPSLAVLEHLLAREPDLPHVFLCSAREIDARILRARQEPFLALPAMPPGAHPTRLASFLRSWGPSVREARRAIRDLRVRATRVVVLSTGGFVSAPVAQAARVERAPLVLLNQDSPPGRANRWVSRFARRVLTTAPNERPGWDRIPPVVRSEAIAPGDARVCRLELGLAPDAPTLFVTGASQGASSINAFAEAFARTHARELVSGSWQVIHQTGPTGAERARAAYAGLGITALVEPFMDRMGLAWGAADVAMSRSGAGSVAEAWANHTPTLFLPYPHHRDQHQRFNAEPLAHAGGALIATDLVDPGENIRTVAPTLLSLLNDTGARSRMRDALEALGPVDGAARVARAILEDGHPGV